MKQLVIIILGVLVASASLQAQSKKGELAVIVNNVEDVEGNISAVLYDTEGGFLEKGTEIVQKVANKESVTLIFKNVKAGTYAVSVIHDQNSDGELDKGMFGIPTEPYGFSNDATGSFGPPTYEDSSFDFSGTKTIEITLN